MAYENLCMYCFKDSGGESVCPHCGKDARAAVPQIQLLPGTPVYRGRFLVGRALGQDTNGIVYTALDTKRGGTIRIREYLPRNCADRLNDGNVVPVPGMEDTFDTGMKKLRASVEGVDDPSKRHFYFEENGTAYIAQRKGSSAAAAPAGMDEGDYEDEGHGRSIALYIAIAAAVVVVIAIGIIWFLSSMDDPDDVTLNNPITTNALQATWKPEATPSPTPYVAPTFAALRDPELSWMEYTYPGNVNNDYQNQVQAQPTRTPEPVVNTSPQYSTINKNSSSKEIATLQTMLAQYGWMDVSDVNGKYDSNTVQAVKDFQTYVNEYCNPSRKLSVDGIAGQKTLQWLLDSSVSIVKPTPTPTPLVTISPNDLNVSPSSPKADITAVQNKLIVLSLLPEGSADGIYGNSTRQAVVDFQVRVNQLQGYNALEITGTVDPLTMAYLNYYVEWWQDRQEQQQPQATQSPEPDSGTVNSTSSRAEVAYVQEMLAGVGLIDESDIDGSYGLATAEAVAHFQQWVNKMRNEHTLNVTGEADLLTQRYLNYCIQNGMRVEEAVETPAPTERPVEIPTQQPTEAPDPDENSVVINADSPKESVRFVQEMLAGIGLLEESGIDGAYGRGTRRAVSTLQEYVNTKKGEQVLEITGECDALTLQYLEYCFDNEMDVAAEIAEWNATPVPTQAPTREPTKEPTREPTQAPTVEPEYDENGVTVNPDSPKESIEYVQEMLAGIGLIDPEGIDGDYGNSTMQAVITFQQFVNAEKGSQVLDVTGLCDALTLQYLEYCFDNEWDVAGMIADKNATTAPTQRPAQPTEAPDPADRVVNANSPVEEITYVQQMLEGIGLIEEDDIDGDYGRGTTSAVTLFQQYVNWKQGQQVLEITGECDALTLQYLEYCFDNGWDVAGEIAGATATKAPTQAPTSEPSAEVGTIRNFRVVIDGMEVYGGTTILKSGTHNITWMADGDVSGYFLYLYDENNKLLNSAEHTSMTGFELDTRSMKPDAVYTLHVGALPVNGGEDDVSWHTLQLMCEFEPTQEPTAKPTQKPSAGKPAINIGSSVYQKDGIAYINDDSIIFSWMADGQVESYTVYLLYEDGTQFSLGETNSTSKTVSSDQLQPGKYKLYVGAKPVGGSDDDIVWSNLPFVMPDAEETAAPTAKPTQMPDDLPPLQYIDSSSRPEDILRMQTYLYAYGLIPLDTQEGVLDENTIFAVITFQQKVNEVLGSNIIPIIDPTAEGFRADEFSVDEITLAYLQDPTILGLSSEDFILG